MRTALLSLLVCSGFAAVGGCAAETTATKPSAGSCPIETFKWDASDRGFDEKSDNETLAQVASTIEADRAIYRAAQGGAKPAFQSVALFAKAPAKFVSNDTFQFALRLRQLECASYAGPLASRRDVIDERFGKLADEVNAKLKAPPKAESHAAPDFYAPRPESK